MPLRGEGNTKTDVFRKKWEERFSKRIKTEVDSDATAQATIISQSEAR